MAITFNGTELDVENSQIFNLSDVDTITFNGTTVFEKNAAPAWDSRGLQYNSWETIQWYIAHGKTSGKIAVGNTKTVAISGNTYTMKVARINDGSSKAEYYPANTADFIAEATTPNQTTNFGSGNNLRGWINSSVRTYLNSTIYNAMPSDLKAVIVAKKNRLRDKNGTWDDVTDKIWSPTLYETVGTNNAFTTYTNTDAFGDESPYNFWYSSVLGDKNSRRRYQVGTTTWGKYWLISTKNVSHLDVNVGNFTSTSYPQNVRDENAGTVNSALICFRIG